MDLVTGANVAVTVIAPVSRQRIWEMITDVQRIGEWSPEAVGGSWPDNRPQLRPGGRFVGKNRYAGGFVSTVTCVVVEADPFARFGWDVLDDDGVVGSMWRYELRDGGEPATTVVRHSFTHGPGNTGLREGAEVSPTAVDRRLAELCRNMTTTITAMVATEHAMGAAR